MSAGGVYWVRIRWPGGQRYYAGLDGRGFAIWSELGPPDCSARTRALVVDRVGAYRAKPYSLEELEALAHGTPLQIHGPAAHWWDYRTDRRTCTECGAVEGYEP